MTRIGEVLEATAVRPSPALIKFVSTASTKLHRAWKQTVAKSEAAADVLVALVTPIALVVLVLGLWRLSADVGWTETFPISDGFFSHWQVWIALAIGLKFGGAALLARIVPAETPSATQKTNPQA